MVGSHKTETVRLLYDVWHFNAVPPPFFSTVVDIVHFLFAECFPLGLKGNPAMPQHVNILFAGTFDRSAEQMAARATRIINEWLCVSLATVTKSQAAVTPLSWLSDAFSKTLVSLVREHRDTVWRKDFETTAYLGYSFFFFPLQYNSLGFKTRMFTQALFVKRTVLITVCSVLLLQTSASFFISYAY